jgi:LPXTG-motif cell wall-anchored protein
MSDLNFLLRRMNQRNAYPRTGRMEDAATATLIGLVALLALALAAVGG